MVGLFPLLSLTVLLGACASGSTELEEACLHGRTLRVVFDEDHWGRPCAVLVIANHTFADPQEEDLPDIVLRQNDLPASGEIEIWGRKHAVLAAVYNSWYVDTRNSAPVSMPWRARRSWGKMTVELKPLDDAVVEAIEERPTLVLGVTSAHGLFDTYAVPVKIQAGPSVWYLIATVCVYVLLSAVLVFLVCRATRRQTVTSAAPPALIRPPTPPLPKPRDGKRDGNDSTPGDTPAL